MRLAGLIVAAGHGTRAGGEMPKQYRSLGGQPVLALAARALLAETRLASLQIVIHPQDLPLYDAMALDDARVLPPVMGGESRSASVRAGLDALAAHAPDAVLIHDAARPGLPLDVIGRLVEALRTHDGAFPVLPVVDALWRGEGGLAIDPVPREGLFRAQTPQAFRYDAIRKAHLGGQDAADDVALARAQGLEVAMVTGDERALKITGPEDFARAERVLGLSMDVRTGNGFDVHAFTAGDHVTLCGIDVPHDRALLGHSDADVGLHALTDAIFGALGEGDIGQWFPPSDPQWKGAASDIFLRKAAERGRERGFALTHLDVTLICERPKVGPHAPAMRARVADIVGIDAERVSVKATTSEKLGFTGRGEGIAALATATLVRA